MFVELDKIPIGPYPNVKGTNCAFDSISEQDQKLKLSGLIREKGWLVLAEIQLAHYRSVSFAGQSDPGTSFTFSISQSSSVVFENEKLVGSISTNNSDSNIIGDLK